MRFSAANGLTAWGQRLLAGAAVLGLACVAASHGAETSAAPLKLRFGGDPTQTRVVLELDQAASAEVISDGSAGGHVVLSFSKLKLGDGLDGQGKGMVKAWSLDKAAGKARLSLDLARHGKIRRRFLLPPSDGVAVYRYVMDIEADGAPTLQKGPAPAQAAPEPARLKTLKASAAQASPPPAATTRARTTQVLADPLSIDPEAPAVAPGLQKVSLPVLLPTPALRKADAKLDAPLPARPTPTKAAYLVRKTIVIDAGHGGRDPGALGGRSHEKDVTLAAARVLKARLERTGRFKVVMTRDSDVYIPLEQRVKIARTAGADLFLSLHADSGGDPKVRGATVYTLSDHGVDRATRSVFGGGFIDVQLPGKDLSVKQIILDLTQRTTRNRSGAFAETLLEHISSKTPLLRRSHRDAGYMVLLAPDVPAVLLEMGFITSPEDESQLTDPDKRAALMDSVGEAIEGYFADNVKVAAQ
jgi:N-acetylmuramoyl-L-alanine amidase